MINGNEEQACEICGSTQNVEYRVDPYKHEINDDNTKYYICFVCYGAKIDDI